MKNELPSTLKAYRYQQHRWSCGPANLFRKMVMEIIRNKVSLLFCSVKYNNFEEVKWKVFCQLTLHFYVSNAESIFVEEGTCDIQLLLYSEDHSPHKHICVLLHCTTRHCSSTRSCSSKVGSSLYSIPHHPSECCWNSKVSYSFLIGLQNFGIEFLKFEGSTIWWKLGSLSYLWVTSLLHLFFCKNSS